MSYFFTHSSDFASHHVKGFHLVSSQLKQINDLLNFFFFSFKVINSLLELGVKSVLLFLKRAGTLPVST